MWTNLTVAVRRSQQALKVTASALDAAAASPEGGAQVPALLQLQAQLEYRKGRNRDCINTYDKLFKQHKVLISHGGRALGGPWCSCAPARQGTHRWVLDGPDAAPIRPVHCAHSLPCTQEDSLELKTNILAAYVAAGLASELPDLMAALRLRPADSFEVAFNRACGTVAAAADAAGPLAGGRLGAATSQQLAAAEGELRMALKQGAWVVPRRQGLQVQPARYVEEIITRFATTLSTPA